MTYSDAERLAERLARRGASHTVGERVAAMQAEAAVASRLIRGSRVKAIRQVFKFGIKQQLWEALQDTGLPIEASSGARNSTGIVLVSPTYPSRRLPSVDARLRHSRLRS
jgi:hypothetical protein